MCNAHASASSSVLGVGGKDTTPDSSRGIGMTLGVGGGVGKDRRDVMVERGPPPAHTSTGLSTSGPAPGIILTPSRDSGQALALSRLRRTFSQSREWGLDSAPDPRGNPLPLYPPLP